eukprot:snap_masked-scaffold_11-processed-gene-11.7-mRNA-1 protein AED:1.00 eAED:1.00 QI:0/-1/0/0/-1/1/1/0/369
MSQQNSGRSLSDESIKGALSLFKQKLPQDLKNKSTCLTLAEKQLNNQKAIESGTAYLVIFSLLNLLLSQQHKANGGNTQWTEKDKVFFDTISSVLSGIKQDNFAQMGLDNNEANEQQLSEKTSQALLNETGKWLTQRNKFRQKGQEKKAFLLQIYAKCCMEAFMNGSHAVPDQTAKGFIRFQEMIQKYDKEREEKKAAMTSAAAALPSAPAPVVTVKAEEVSDEPKESFSERVNMQLGNMPRNEQMSVRNMSFLRQESIKIPEERPSSFRKAEEFVRTAVEAIKGNEVGVCVGDIIKALKELRQPAPNMTRMNMDALYVTTVTKHDVVEYLVFAARTLESAGLLLTIGEATEMASNHLRGALKEIEAQN